jgi:hypothetical protein
MIFGEQYEISTFHLPIDFFALYTRRYNITKIVSSSFLWLDTHIYIERLEGHVVQFSNYGIVLL